MNLFQIFSVFFKTGAILLGGGYVIFPILKSELVEKRNWLTLEEFTEIFLISQSLPGIIAVNTAIFTGNKCKGFLGSLFALLGIITAPMLSIIILASFIQSLSNLSIIQGVLSGVTIGIIALLILSAKDIASNIPFNKTTIAIFVFVLSAMLIFKNLSPAIIIFLVIFIGIIRACFLTFKTRRQ